MSKRKTHNKDCLRLLGKDFDEVHAYLDFYTAEFPVYIYLERHRQFRHNAKGIRECQEFFGPWGELAAKIHLVRDNELYVLTKPFDQVRIEEIDELYKKALKYC